MKTDAPSYHGYRFPPEIISHAVWLYHRFCVSFRNVEELLAQRGITVSYEAVRLWCIKFGPEYARRLKRRQGRLGDTWHLDEVFIKIQGERQYLWRAVDQDGDVIDILVQPRRESSPIPSPPRPILSNCPTLVIRKKEDRSEAAEHSRSKTRNQRRIDFLRSTMASSTGVSSVCWRTRRVTVGSVSPGSTVKTVEFKMSLLAGVQEDLLAIGEVVRKGRTLATCRLEVVAWGGIRVRLRSLCLLFLHPRAPNLIGLRSAGTMPT